MQRRSGRTFIFSSRSNKTSRRLSKSTIAPPHYRDQVPHHELSFSFGENRIRIWLLSAWPGRRSSPPTAIYGLILTTIPHHQQPYNCTQTPLHKTKKKPPDFTQNHTTVTPTARNSKLQHLLFFVDVARLWPDIGAPFAGPCCNLAFVLQILRCFPQFSHTNHTREKNKLVRNTGTRYSDPTNGECKIATAYSFSFSVP